MDTNQYIEINPKIMMGKPIIRGTRITVQQILEQLSAGNSVEDIIHPHPHLVNDQVKAALAFAAEIMQGDEIYPIAI